MWFPVRSTFFSICFFDTLTVGPWDQNCLRPIRHTTWPPPRKSEGSLHGETLSRVGPLASPWTWLKIRGLQDFFWDRMIDQTWAKNKTNEKLHQPLQRRASAGHVVHTPWPANRCSTSPRGEPSTRRSAGTGAGEAGTGQKSMGSTWKLPETWKTHGKTLGIHEKNHRKNHGTYGKTSCLLFGGQLSSLTALCCNGLLDDQVSPQVPTLQILNRRGAGCLLGKRRRRSFV